MSDKSDGNTVETAPVMPLVFRGLQRRSDNLKGQRFPFKKIMKNAYIALVYLFAILFRVKVMRILDHDIANEERIKRINRNSRRAGNRVILNNAKVIVLSSAVFAVVLILFYLILPVVSFRVMFPSASLFVYLLLYLIGLSCELLPIVGIIASTIKLSAGKKEPHKSSKMIAYWSYVAGTIICPMIILYGLFFFHHKRFPLGFLVYLLLMLSLCFAGLFFTIHFVTLVSSIFRLQLMKNYSRDYVAYKLADFHDVLEKRNDRWSQTTFKRDAINRIEDIANCLERLVFREIRAGDTASDIWLSNTAAAKAAGIRDLKKWILMPQPSTQTEFSKRIRELFIHAVLGEWDLFPTAEPVLKERVWISKVLTIGHTLLIAALPILLFWLYQKTPFKLTGVFANYLKFSATCYSLITLMSAIDPNLIAKFGVIKDAYQAIQTVAIKKDKS